jgi:hypothetical protein
MEKIKLALADLKTRQPQRVPSLLGRPWISKRGIGKWKTHLSGVAVTSFSQAIGA